MNAMHAPPSIRTKAQAYCEFYILNIQIYSGRCFLFISEIEYKFCILYSCVKCMVDARMRGLGTKKKTGNQHFVNPWNPNEVKSLIKLRLKSHNLHPCHSFSFDKKGCNVMRLWVARDAPGGHLNSQHIFFVERHSNFILIQSNIT